MLNTKNLYHYLKIEYKIFNKRHFYTRAKNNELCLIVKVNIPIDFKSKSVVFTKLLFYQLNV